MSGHGPGFFGKLRAHGDFVERRLAPPLRLSLDAWLQRALLHSRRELGALWLPAWLNGPLWRFALAPGVATARACAGVLMPSLDRVDRAFPLVIALELSEPPALASCIGLQDAWFGALEDLALSTLEPDFSIDAFDAALRALGAPAQAYAHPDAYARAYAPAPARAPDPTAALGASSGVGWVTPLGGSALPPLAHAALAERSAWWTAGAPAVDPCLALCDGLPAPAAFGALFDNAWEARGWRRV